MRRHAKAPSAGPNARSARPALFLAAALLATMALVAPAARAAAPSITGVTMARVTTEAAQLNARVNPEGNEVTDCHFEWGPTAAYGNSSPCLANTATEAPFAGATGTVLLPTAALLTGLSPASTYHFQLSVTTSEGTVTSTDDSFETAAPYPSCPRVGQCVGADGERTIEWVSTVPTNRQPVVSAKLAADGDQALYAIAGGTPGSTSGGFSWYQARRDANGWVSENLLPSPSGQLGTLYQAMLTSPDLSKVAMTVTTGFFAGSSPPVSWVTLAGGAQSLLHTFPSSAPAEVSPIGSPAIAASESLSRIYVNSPQDIDPADTNGHRDVYLLNDGGPTLVSRLPDNSIPSCGVTEDTSAGFATQRISSSIFQHWVSTEGDKVFFESQGNTCASSSDPRQLYRRDVDAGTTTLISGPVTSGSDLGVGRSGRPGLLQAAADGSWVLYRTATALDPSDTDATFDVYRWEEGVGNTCLTCVAPIAAAVSNGVRSAVASEDGSHVYFNSNAKLTPDAPASGTKIYVWRAPGEISYVAPNADSGLGPSRAVGADDVTQDGNVLVFEENKAGVTADNNAGQMQFYRYDDRDRSMVCLSCRAGAASTHPANNKLTQFFGGIDDGSAISTDGETIAFDTPESLVSQDANGVDDLYEWHDGKLGLLTQGGPLVPGLYKVSPDGRDILYVATEALAPGADQTTQLYDARIGGGFPEPPIPPEACTGEGCKGAAGSAPSESGPATPSFSGPANPKPCRSHGRRHHRKRCHHKQSKRHSAGRAANSNRGGVK